jgi:hypothetical protein
MGLAGTPARTDLETQDCDRGRGHGISHYGTDDDEDGSLRCWLGVEKAGGIPPSDVDDGFIQGWEIVPLGGKVHLEEYFPTLVLQGEDISRTQGVSI